MRFRGLCLNCGSRRERTVEVGGRHATIDQKMGIRILVWEDRTSPSCLTALVR